MGRLFLCSYDFSNCFTCEICCLRNTRNNSNFNLIVLTFEVPSNLIVSIGFQLFLSKTFIKLKLPISQFNMICLNFSLTKVMIKLRKESGTFPEVLFILEA